MVLGERGDVYGPTLAATPLACIFPGRVSSVQSCPGLAWSVMLSREVCPALRRGSPRSYARRWRGSRYMSRVPAWLVMPYAAPLRSTPSASRRETRRHFVPSRSLLGRSRRSAPLRGRWCRRRSACKRSPRRSGLVMPVAEEANRHAKPSAPRLRARLDAGLGKVRRWAAPLVLARWPRAALPPSTGGRSAGILAERFGCSAADCS